MVNHVPPKSLGWDEHASLSMNEWMGETPMDFRAQS